MPFDFMKPSFMPNTGGFAGGFPAKGIGLSGNPMPPFNPLKSYPTGISSVNGLAPAVRGSIPQRMGMFDRFRQGIKKPANWMNVMSNFGNTMSMGQPNQNPISPFRPTQIEPREPRMPMRRRAMDYF